MCSIVAFRRKGRNWSVTTTEKKTNAMEQWYYASFIDNGFPANQTYRKQQKKTCVTLYSTRGPIIIQSKEILYIDGKKGETSTELVILRRKKNYICRYKNFAQRTGNRTGWQYDVLFYFLLKCSIALFYWAERFLHQRRKKTNKEIKTSMRWSWR